MRAPAAVALVAGLTVAIVSAVIVTGVRSEARADAHPTTPTVALARGGPAGAVVTVPTLSGVVDSSAPSLRISAADPAAGQSAAAQVSEQAEASAQAKASAAAAASSASSSRASSSRASASRAAASRAAASRAAASRAAASSAAVSSSSSAASRAAASSAAASSSSVASRAAASSAAASSAAASSAAASSAAASQASASSSLAAAIRSAAADPAPDTTKAVEEAVEAANQSGVTESVVVMNRQTGSVTTSIDADAAVPSMSLVKLMLAADVIDQAGGPDQVDSDTLARLHQMIAASDDSIAQDFYDADGRSAIITRVAADYGLTGTTPAPDPEYWGDVRVTAHDMASLVYQLLSSRFSGLWFAEAMEAAQDTGADGFDQDFGMNALPGTGSKQGWGCCLDDVLAIHSVGFTAGQIVVVLSTSVPDAAADKLSTAEQLSADPGVQAARAAVSSTAAAAVAGRQE